MQLLRQYNLAGELHGEMQPLLDKVQAIADQEPTPQKVYAFAELSYIAGKKVELTSPAAALDHYGASVTYAYKYLFDERYSPLRNPYDPEFRGACDLYNGSLESGLRIVKQQGALLPGRSHSIESASQAWDVKIVIRSDRWQAADFAELKFVSDYEVQGLKNQYHSYGLGVPLIAIRSKQDSNDPAEKFMPPLMSFPVTAFLRVLPDDQMHATSSRRRHVALLELYDPLGSSDIEIGSRRVPLETDLSTPLAYFLNDPQLDLSDPKINLDAIATEGLLRPDKTQAETGLYMLQPYEPGKIPVLMVHGLWSSPMTWMEMFNDLRGDPAVRSRYQFWFYLYPTGQPFWQSATKLREDLAHARAVLDPQHREPAFDQMVLVGHSMGGLVSKMQVVASRNDFWNVVSDKPFTTVKASPEGRQQSGAHVLLPARPCRATADHHRHSAPRQPLRQRRHALARARAHPAAPDGTRGHYRGKLRLVPRAHAAGSPHGRRFASARLAHSARAFTSAAAALAEVSQYRGRAARQRNHRLSGRRIRRRGQLRQRAPGRCRIGIES